MVPTDLMKLSDVVDNNVVKKQCMINLFQCLMVKI